MNDGKDQQPLEEGEYVKSMSFWLSCFCLIASMRPIGLLVVSRRMQPVVVCEQEVNLPKGDAETPAALRWEPVESNPRTSKVHCFSWQCKQVNEVVSG